MDMSGNATKAIIKATCEEGRENVNGFVLLLEGN